MKKPILSLGFLLGILAAVLVPCHVVSAQVPTPVDEFICLSTSNEPPYLVGCWGPVMEWQLDAVHSIVLKTRKVLIFGTSFPSQCRLFDSTNDTIGPIFAGPLDHWMFCSGHAQLADGKVLIGGGIGGGVGFTSIFDPLLPPPACWTDTGPPPAERFYPTLTTLATGNMLVTAGETGDPAVRTPNVFLFPAPFDPPWRLLTGATYCGPELNCLPPIYNFNINYFPFMFQLSNGLVVAAGSETSEYNSSSPKTRVLDPVLETWTDLFAQPDAIGGGTAVMIRPNLVIKAGGHDSTFVPTNRAYRLDATSFTPQWVQLASMSFARDDFYLVALADGKVLAIGGGDGVGNPVMRPELYDPTNDPAGWTQMARMALPRQYHSSSVLLPDARVLIAGPDTTAQIFYPPYLFSPTGGLARRPKIDQVFGSAENVINYGLPFRVSTQSAVSITSVSLVRLGASTHSFDHNQRFQPLRFTLAGHSILTVSAPAHAYEAPQGFYMLFILSGRVPSKAAIVELK